MTSTIKYGALPSECRPAIARGAMPPKQLPSWARAITQGGADWSARYDDKFKARRAIVLSAVNAGWSFEDCYRAFLADASSPAFDIWTGRAAPTLAAMTKRLREDFEKARAKASKEPPIKFADEARKTIGEIIALVNSVAWSGRAGRTDRDVMLYVLSEATRIASTTVRVSARDAAAGAGLGNAMTASRSLLRLCKAGWLRQTGERELAIQAQEYLVRKAEKKVSQNVTYLPQVQSQRLYVTNCDKPGDVTSPAHEVWQRSGSAARVLWLALDESPATAGELAMLADVHRSTAYRYLPRLARVGLAEKRDDGWSLGPVTPDDLVTDMGWTKDDSRTQQRAERFRAEREYWQHKYGNATPPQSGTVLSLGTSGAQAID